MTRHTRRITLTFAIPLADGTLVYIEVPDDITSDEMDRVCKVLRTVPLDAPEHEAARAALEARQEHTP